MNLAWMLCADLAASREAPKSLGGEQHADANRILARTIWQQQEETTGAGRRCNVRSPKLLCPELQNKTFYSVKPPRFLLLKVFLSSREGMLQEVQCWTDKRLVVSAEGGAWQLKAGGFANSSGGKKTPSQSQKR